MPNIHDKQNIKILHQLRSITGLHCAMSEIEAEGKSIATEMWGIPLPRYISHGRQVFPSLPPNPGHGVAGILCRGRDLGQSRVQKTQRFRSRFQSLDLTFPLKGRISLLSPKAKARGEEGLYNQPIHQPRTLQPIPECPPRCLFSSHHLGSL